MLVETNNCPNTRLFLGVGGKSFPFFFLYCKPSKNAANPQYLRNLPQLLVIYFLARAALENLQEL